MAPVRTRVTERGMITKTHLELAVAAGDAHGRVVAHNLSSDHGQGLALSRVDLAGHDAGTGLVLREGEFAQAAARAGAEVPDVVGDLHERAGDDVERAVSLDEGVVRGEGFELEFFDEIRVSYDMAFFGRPKCTEPC